LEKEFVLDKEGFSKAADFMASKNLIIDSEGMVYIPAEKKKYLELWDGLIENYLEAYLIVGRNLEHLEAKGKAGKDILKAINKHGIRMYKKGEIKRVESLCLPHYKGALDTFKAKGIIDSNNSIRNKEKLQDITRHIGAYLED
jgi:ribosomal protein S20